MKQEIILALKYIFQSFENAPGALRRNIYRCSKTSLCKRLISTLGDWILGLRRMRDSC